MKAFVLAAGFGTRLRPLTDHLPKPLVPVLNIPGLFYTFALLKKAGITEIICNIHHHADSIRRQIETSCIPGLTITFSVEPEILGTGGGLKHCQPLLGEEDFLLVNSDIITDIDFRELADAHQRSGLAGTLCLHPTPDAPSIGTVGVEDGLVCDFANRRGTGIASSYIYTGSAVFSPAIFEHLHPGFSGIVETGFNGLLERHQLGYHEHRGLWRDIGTLTSYREANLSANEVINRTGEAVEAATGTKPHKISPDALIHPSALIDGSVIGADCRIGEDCRIEGSVLLPGTIVPDGTALSGAVADPWNCLTSGEPLKNMRVR
ncbi:NDP-sugar synthase [Chlorobium phaeovibrioides]|uniref:NDP-sugar synthase n=1 Tax=Chlorobium phaeovibrioides TaxID=1094 RepID=A0A432AWY8_CHLPH|nr:nucleotidyltransferase family protein [Chlorobium phaeovibrioides]MWV53810.1 NTP transferase domain-containing protein [Chlorobium phaeovibrioides]RTY36597.1 NDP-sugar synthase [Chlorobium phaeovibrioides]RTY39482.1 NDP-sugar synthase [Chlorobium phaeovibrioides]